MMTVNTNDGHGRRRTQFRLWNPHEFVEGSAVGAREVSGRPAWHAWPIHDFWRCTNDGSFECRLRHPAVSESCRTTVICRHQHSVIFAVAATLGARADGFQTYRHPNSRSAPA